MRWFATKCVLGAHNRQTDLRSQILTDIFVRGFFSIKLLRSSLRSGRAVFIRGHLKKNLDLVKKGEGIFSGGQLCFRVRLYRKEVSIAPNHIYSPQSSSPSLFSWHLPHKKPNPWSSTILPLYEAFTQKDSHLALQEAPTVHPQGFHGGRRRKHSTHPTALPVEFPNV